MSSLEFPIVKISDLGLRIDVTVPAEALCPPDTAPLPLREVAVHGELTPLIGQYLFQGSVEAVFHSACDRCLEEATLPVSVPVVWTFEEVADSGPRGEEALELEEVEAHGVYTFDGITVDLTRPVWNEAVLALQSKFVCR